MSATIPCLGTAPCRVSLFAYPLAYDLDRDGTLDLVVGDGRNQRSELFDKLEDGCWKHFENASNLSASGTKGPPALGWK